MKSVRRLDNLFLRLLLLQTLLILAVSVIFGVLFYSERNVSLARLTADRLAPRLLEAAGLTGGSALAEGPLARFAALPQGAVTIPPVGPRLATLREALIAQGVPVVSFAFSRPDPNSDRRTLWLKLQPGAAVGAFWVQLPGDIVISHVGVRLLANAGVCMALLVAASWWFTRRLTRPLEQLRRAIETQDPAQATAVEPPPIDERATPEVLAMDRAWRGLLARTRQHESERSLLLAGVSHDLRSPLARIRLAAEILPDGPATSPRREAIVRNVETACALIDTFVDYVRAGELPLDECCDLADITRTVVKRLGHGEQALTLTAPQALRSSPCNSQLFERAVCNLIDNAFQHGRVPVHVRLFDDGRSAIVEVSDHGEGIAPAFRPTAFQAFARGDQSRSQPGAGLGLAMVGRLVQRVGGRITFVDPETEATHGIRLHVPLNR
jgi:two-component system osmolarity sensor histidine kinase EnvZ